MISKSDLEYWYIHKEESISFLKKKFRVGHKTLMNYFSKFDIPLRTFSQSQQISYKKSKKIQDTLQKGRRNGNRFEKGNLLQYKHGASQYRLTKELLSEPFCHICGTDDKRLVIHHLDFNRMNNSLSNLIILCDSCHRLEHKYYEKFAEGKAIYESIEKEINAKRLH